MNPEVYFLLGCRSVHSKTIWGGNSEQVSSQVSGWAALLPSLGTNVQGLLPQGLGWEQAALLPPSPHCPHSELSHNSFQTRMR